ncbi:unnamed protein product, partial [Ectocarpus sp. 8 AP-2014]
CCCLRCGCHGPWLTPCLSAPAAGAAGAAEQSPRAARRDATSSLDVLVFVACTCTSAVALDSNRRTGVYHGRSSPVFEGTIATKIALANFEGVTAGACSPSLESEEPGRRNTCPFSFVAGVTLDYILLSNLPTRVFASHRTKHRRTRVLPHWNLTSTL